MPFKITMFAAVVLIGIAVGSIIYRLQKSKPIMKSEFREPRFSETWCSGQSDRNVLARLGIAKNILWVVVTKTNCTSVLTSRLALCFFLRHLDWIIGFLAEPLWKCGTNPLRPLRTVF